ncbi:MAG: sulfur carrier protein [Thermococcaceae archaeon]|nr:sulfur carrier protein [Thermococcaceae archaeon]
MLVRFDKVKKLRAHDSPVIAVIRIKVIGRKIEKEIEYQKGMKVKDVLKEVGFNTESAIAKVNGKVALEDDPVKDGDYVEVIPVVSGG